MASLTGDDGSEDVNDFLARIKELGDKRDREDEERTRKLEEEILKGRQERAARRAERARSISPTKDSPASVLSSAPASQSVLQAATPLKPDMPSSSQASSASTSASPFSTEPAKPTPPPQTSLARSGTLSWQQRPGSRGNTPTVRSRPLSMAAFDNSSMRSPTATPEPASAQEREKFAPNREKTPSNAGRAESPATAGSPNAVAASMLSNKDPSWFKQTPERGLGSAAFRKSEEPTDTPERGGSIRLHGLSRESTAEPDKSVGSVSSLRGGRPKSMVGSFATPDAARLDAQNQVDSALERTPTMSPAQGRLSRPSSPTKGVGGFVQSAMLKRSDSVTKRWSTQTPGGLSRHNSVESKRGSRDVGLMSFSPPPADADTAAIATKLAVNEPAQPTPIRDKDGFIKPALPQTPQDSTKSPLSDTSTSRPSSPTKDPKRWSPIKTSWLENTLNKPESPKPLKSAARQQPAWMAELQKTKAARASADLGRGGDGTAKLFQSVTPGKIVPEPRKPASQIDQPRGSSDRSDMTPKPESTKPNLTEPRQSHTELEQSPEKEVSESPEPAPDAHSSAQAAAPPVKPKPETPPKKDFRANLKSRVPEADKGSADVPEFKKAFGNLKRAETKSYKAPDTLKENILRGKTGLNATGGPQQSKRVDEFKESILAKKKQFSEASTKPTAKNPSQLTEKPLPEALAKRTGLLNRTQSIGETSERSAESAAPMQDLKPSVSAPENPTAIGRGAGIKGSALAARFNPNLAGILAKGPAALGASGSKPSGPAGSNGSGATVENTEHTGPELTHQTKGRARGPKRKPPKTTASGNVTSAGSKEPLSSDAALKKPDQTKSMQAKLDSYDQMKRDLVGQVDRVDALGISTAPEPKAVSASTAQSPSTPQASSKQALSVEKNKPPAPRSPSTRVAGGILGSSTPPPKDSSHPTPLSTVASTSNRVNSSESLPAHAKKSLAEEEASKASSPLKDKAPTTPATTRLGSFPLTDTPPKPISSSARVSVASPVSLANSARSPPIPAKSAIARNLPKSVGSPAGKTVDRELDTTAKNVVEEFFGPLPPPSKSRPDIDTQSIINNASSTGGKIKTLRKQIWELSSDGKRSPMPTQGEYILYEESMYLCIHTFGSAAGKHTIEAYLWVGDGVSPSSAEDSQLFARNAAKEAGATGKLIVLHQGKESGYFFEALGGIVVIRKGSSQSSTGKYMLCGRQHMGQIAFDELEFHARSLCSGFPFIVATASGHLFLWKGKGAGASELGCARLIAMDLCLTGNVEEVEEDNEPDQFWEALGSRDRPDINITQHWPLKASKDSFTTRLFAVDDARPKSAGLAAIQGFQAVWNRRPSAVSNDDPGTSDIREVSPFAQSDLAQDGIFVLDAYFEVYVVLGWRSSSRFPAFKSALVFAQEYAILAASQEDRPFVPAAHVIFAGASAPYFKSSFRKWDDRRVTTQPVGSASETETVPIHEALAAVTE